MYSKKLQGIVALDETKKIWIEDGVHRYITKHPKLKARKDLQKILFRLVSNNNFIIKSN